MNKTENQAFVVFQPSGRKGYFDVGTPLLDAARTLGVYIESVCGGRGICGKCQVSIAEGKFAKFQINCTPAALSAIGPVEKRYNEKRGLADGRRLSCAATIQSDLVIDVPDTGTIVGQTIRKDASTTGMTRKPAVHACYVEIDKPKMENAPGDNERLVAALTRQFGLANIKTAHFLKRDLQQTLRKADWQVTAIVRTEMGQSDIIALRQGYDDLVAGLAVDIGSTTIAAHLVDLSNGEILGSTGIANPQIRFGEDLMSRVSYVMMNENGIDHLNKAAIGAINTLIDRLTEIAGIHRDAIVDAVIVANPIMHHLFLGWDPTGTGQAPFTLVQSAALRTDARNTGLNLHQGTAIYTLPLVSGHVGADTTAVLLAEQPEKEDHPVLIVDVGTNAEIVLWDGRQLYCASSPTGPAFEGAETSCGQRAAPGAIERIRIDRQSLTCRFKIIGVDVWSDDPAFSENAKKTGVTGICGSGIIELLGEMLLAGIVAPDGTIRGPASRNEEQVLKANDRTWSFIVHKGTPDIVVTQNDIRAIQLAKAALYAGVKLLMRKSGLEEICQIRLAGAFGSYIDPAYAMLLGLVPDCPVKNVRSVGNAAGQGALIALLDESARARIEELVKQVIRVETALEPAFQDLFVAAMAIPNNEDRFEQTRQLFGAPEFEITKSTERTRRRGRGRGRGRSG